MAPKLITIRVSGRDWRNKFAPGQLPSNATLAAWFREIAPSVYARTDFTGASISYDSKKDDVVIKAKEKSR